MLDELSDKDRRDLRDRAAYLFITGCFPSHLRRHFTRLLVAITTASSRPTSLDGVTGVMLIDRVIVDRLRLEAHPMVQRVRKRLREGYRIAVSRGQNCRNPYTKIFLSRGSGAEDQQIIVQIDGSEHDSWQPLR